MDGDGPPPTAAAAAPSEPETSVLGDEDLLREILLRLGLPTFLLRAALVSNRWLLHASDQAFLRRFRERNPPRLLGFYAGYPGRFQFVSLPQPPELAALSRRAAGRYDVFACGAERLMHCRNGRLVTEFRSHWRRLRDGRSKHYLLAPLLAGESADALPPAPPPVHVLAQGRFTQMFLPEDGGRDGITLVQIFMLGRKVYAEVYVLGSGGWGVPAIAVTETELPRATDFLKEMLPPVPGKAFAMMTNSGYTLGLDLATATFFTLELPVGVRRSYALSCGEDSGLYLVSADGFQLSVWLHGMTGDSDGAGGWLLVDTFCVREAYSSAAGHNWVWMPHDGDFLGVAAVGDNAEFVFLDYARYGVVLYVHPRTRVVEKVYEQAPYVHGNVNPGISRIHISPFMMMWPPVFPALNGGHDQEQ